MAVIKISRKVFSSIFDISHDISGSLNLSNRTYITLSSSIFRGEGDYKLFNYSSLSMSSNYVSVRSLLDIKLENSDYEAYAKINNNSIYANVVNTSNMNKNNVQTIDNGIISIAGPTEIELDSSLFNTAGIYALFDYRLGDISGSLSDITLSISGSTTLTASAPYIMGPYLATTLS